MTSPEGSKSVLVPIIVMSVFAAGAVAAVMTGVVPNPFKSAEQTASTTTAVQNPAPAEAIKKPVAAKTPVAAKAKVAKASPEVCRECGVVEAIDSFSEKGQASGGGAVAGGVIGGIIGNQIGRGRGKDLATVAGVVGGAIAGNEIEKNTKKVTRYRIALRMDDGTRQQLTLDAANGVAVGDKVKIIDGALVRN
jgi:outer membrane lipoprotein SlyB